MSKAVKIWLVAATLLLIVGVVLFAIAFVAADGDITKLGTVKYVLYSCEINEEFDSISINTDTADIEFLPSENEKCRVECYERQNEHHLTTVSNDTLSIDLNDTRKWYDYIEIGFGTPKITVYLPEKEYSVLTVNESTGDVKIPREFSFDSIDIWASTGDIECRASAKGMIKIKLSTGDIELDSLSAHELDLSTTTGEIGISSVKCDENISIGVSTGDVEIENTTCKSLVSKGSTGDVTLENAVASERINIERSTGDVSLDGCDAADIFIKTTTGDIAGSLLSEKVFVAESSTGKVTVPSGSGNEKCEIICSTGNIRIVIE